MLKFRSFQMQDIFPARSLTKSKTSAKSFPFLQHLLSTVSIISKKKNTKQRIQLNENSCMNSVFESILSFLPSAPITVLNIMWNKRERKSKHK